MEDNESAALSSPYPSPQSLAVILPTPEPTPPSTAWQPILSSSTQIVLYNPTSHALSVVRPPTPSHDATSCPYCHRPLEAPDDHDEPPLEAQDMAQNYFKLLEISNDTYSRPASPQLRSVSGGTDASKRSEDGELPVESMAEGYFRTFFKEDCRLGMGANGSVFLCQHVLNGNPLGRFAVKKIAVGQSHKYLLDTLREVRLLESLRHPNIITYHHTWLETHQFSSFGPRVPTLFVLMQWAECGSLEDFIELRLGRPQAQSNSQSNGVVPDLNAIRSRSERIRAFRAAQKSTDPTKEAAKGGRNRAGSCTTAVHLFSAEEVKSLFCDVVSGLAFLHDRSILHLDLKPGNVLLTLDAGQLIPRAMLSDFGTSQDMVNPPQNRTGNTGTLEYAAPESLRSPSTGLLAQVDSKADMWSLGMILYVMLFFRLPYHFSTSGEGGDAVRGSRGNADIMKNLEAEILRYPGFRQSPHVTAILEARGISQAYSFLLEGLLHITPATRPSSERVLRVVKDGNLDPLSPTSGTKIVGRHISPNRGPSTPPHLPLPPAQQDESSQTTPSLVDPDQLELEPSTPVQDQSLLGKEPTTQPGPIPIPIPAPIPEPSSWWRSMDNVLHNQYFTYPYLVRALKSGALVAKIISLQLKCPSSRPDPYFLCFMTILAVSDTWFDSLRSTVLSTVLHVAILRWNCRESVCCV